jgi:hypothetical protein
VPRAPPAPPPAVRNLTLSRELLPPRADGSTLPPLLFANLTNGVLQSQLRDMRAAGVSATREPLVLLCDVAELTDGATYYVAPPGDMGEAESLKQQARGALGAKRPLRGVGASDGLRHLLTRLCCPNRPAATTHRPSSCRAGFKPHRSQHQPGHRPGARGRRVRVPHRSHAAPR